MLEQLNQPLGAVREYEQAAVLDPNEANLFDWGSELLLHRAIAPAIEVFSKGTPVVPGFFTNSAWTSGGTCTRRDLTTSAARYLVEASDLDPKDSNPYLFMGRMVSAQAIDRRRFPSAWRDLPSFSLRTHRQTTSTPEASGSKAARRANSAGQREG